MNRSTVCAMKLAPLAIIGLLASLAGCDQSVNESKTSLAAGNKAIGSKQFDQAIVDCQKAADKWRDNHSAYWCLGIAYSKKGDWGKAVDAYAETVKLAPEQSMYQMWYGVSLYEKAVASARDDQARKENKKPEEIQDVDLGSINFEKPIQHLTEAVKLNDGLWRAHYYLGKIYRHTDKPKDGAEQLSKAIAANPREPGPYVGLGELYRKWDYTDQAIKVAQAGTVNVPGQNEVSDIWFVLGMGYDDKRSDKEAIEAFTKAIETRKDNHKAKFQRGQAYFRQKDYLNAKRDLEEFAKASGASLDFAKQQASKMLMDIAVATAPKDAPPTEKQSPEDLVNGKKGKKK